MRIESEVTVFSVDCAFYKKLRAKGNLLFAVNKDTIYH